MNIELHIERLVLEGLEVEPRHRSHLQAALEGELARLLATAGLRSELLTGGAMRSLRAGEVHLANQMQAAQLGNHIAQAVYGGIGANARPSTR